SLVVEKLSNESNLLSISAVNYRGLNDNDMGIFSNISSQIAWIKLNDTQITDKSLQVLAKLPNLVRLDLSYTKISDGGVSYLSGSKNLEYLNLVGTQVSNATLNKLAAIKTLKKVFLWKTAISKEALKAFEGANPGIKVYSEWENSTPTSVKVEKKTI
ncbi:MAG: hypothetical protein ACRCVT_09995, partial [Leadbetterella sp.]